MNYQEDYNTLAQIIRLSYFMVLCTIGLISYMLYNFEKFKYNVLIFISLTILIYVLMIQKVIRIKEDILSYIYYVNIPSLIFLILLAFFPISNLFQSKNSVRNSNAKTSNAKNPFASKSNNNGAN
jgi:hypothetical protein